MTKIWSAALVAAAVLLAGCGTANDASEAVDADPAGAMCAPDVPDCVDAPIRDGDTMDDDQAQAEARALLGLGEADLPPHVRVGRRGGEHMMLTEDHVPGRMTVELDDDGTGHYIVSSVTLEVSDGVETFTD